MALATGLSVATIANLEGHRTVVSPDTIDRVSRALEEHGIIILAHAPERGRAKAVGILFEERLVG